MKYVMVACTDGNGLPRRFPFLFPDAIAHRTVATSAVDLLTFNGYRDARAASAGFVRVAGGVSVQGGSTTLGLETDAADAIVIAKEAAR